MSERSYHGATSRFDRVEVKFLPLKVEHFEKGLKNGNTADQQILNGLSHTEKKLVNYFDRIEIWGKFNRKVAVLLTPSMVKSIKTLIHQNVTANTCLPHLVEKGHTEAVASPENMPKKLV